MRTTAKQIKRFPILFFILIGIYFLLSLCYCYRHIGRTKSIDVTINHDSGKTYQRVQLKDAQFITGIEGTLHWKVKTMKEALLVNLANKKTVFNFYDLCYFLILNLAIYWMVKDLTEDTAFSEKVFKGLRMISFIIGLYPLMTLVNNQIADLAVEKLTNNQFSSIGQSLNLMKFMLIVFLIQLVVVFFGKGKKLQEEQQLTI